MQAIMIDSEFAGFIAPLSDAEHQGLEADLQCNGCLTPLVVWNGLLVDGHNRYAICRKYDISFSVVELRVETRNEVKTWIVNNQLGRRNLNQFQRAELALRLEPMIAEMAKQNQGLRTDLLQNSVKSPNPINTQKATAAQAGISHDTVAKVKHIVAVADTPLKEQLRRGEVSINHAYSGLKRKERSAALVVSNRTFPEPISEIVGWYLGDWNEWVEKLPNESVALLLTDPYQTISSHSNRNAERHSALLKEHSEKAIQEFQDMLSQFHTKLRNDAHLLCFTDWKREPEVRLALEAAGYRLRGSLIWVKINQSNGTPNGSFAPKHERILHAVKGNPHLVQRFPDVLEVEIMPTDRHPSEKPLALLQTLIQATTECNELVADPFGGVASTLVAARGLDRKYWGCELDENYYNIGRDRLAGVES